VYSRLVAAWRDNAKRLTARDRAVDAAIALLVFGAAVGLLFSNGLGPPPADTRDGDALGVALLVLACLPLVFRRVAPSLVLVLTTAPVVPFILLHYPGEISNLPVIAVYTLAAAGDRDPAYGSAAKVLAAIAFIALATAVVIVDDGGFPAPELAAIGVLWLAFWIAGDRARLRRERIAELEGQMRRVRREAERERRLAAAEERTKIARELHDSAGHAMNVILVEAGAARLLRDRDPDRSRAALETIEQVARATIGEIDRLVRGLREFGQTEDPPGAPLPSLEDIELLADRQRSVGRPVTTRFEGEHRPLPSDVERAAYRIVQEALMNAVRHGGGDVDVLVKYNPRALEVNVTNPLRPPGHRVPLKGWVPSNGSTGAEGGHGIVGMRERASLLGGTLEAQRVDGTFFVRALLPYDSDVV
jgi:signal transduction histidine kinase